VITRRWLILQKKRNVDAVPLTTGRKRSDGSIAAPYSADNVGIVASFIQDFIRTNVLLIPTHIMDTITKEEWKQVETNIFLVLKESLRFPLVCVLFTRTQNLIFYGSWKNTHMLKKKTCHWDVLNLKRAGIV